MIDASEEALDSAGFSVGRNVPYGGAIAPTQFQGRTDFVAMMIEVNKSVYLDCGDLRLDAFEILKQALSKIVDIARNLPIIREHQLGKVAQKR